MAPAALVTAIQSPGAKPAPAGMVPPLPVPGEEQRPVPRTRGDGPNSLVTTSYAVACSPHPRGRSPGLATITYLAALFRTRGEGPCQDSALLLGLVCSHPRGWSRCQHVDASDHPLLPAPAEMVSTGRSLPVNALVCFPRPRGWSAQPKPVTAPLCCSRISRRQTSPSRAAYSSPPPRMYGCLPVPSI